MGKGTDKLYITHSEWSSADAYGASAGSNAGNSNNGKAAPVAGRFRRLPFNFCAASLQPFKNPVCTPDGTIFDVEVIGAWLDNHDTNPVDGKPLAARDLIRLDFARNSDDGDGGGAGDLIDPVTFKVFTDNTHIVAVRHGTYANVFAWDTVERMNVKAKMWRDLVDDTAFTRADIITLQDPLDAAARDLGSFAHLQDGAEGALLTPEQLEERRTGGGGSGNVNIAALGRIGDKVLRAKEAVEHARREREAGGDVNKAATKALAAKLGAAGGGAAASHPSMIHEKKVARNTAAYTTGKAAASFTSTGLTPETSGERAVLSDEEWMLKPRQVKVKGYARIDTNLGALTVELQTETAPKAVWNFIRLAQKGYYKGVAFHRSIRNFMIQGGDPTGTGKGGTSIWGRNFADEFEGPLTHEARGVMSMANKGKNTNSSQFFITYRPARHLDRKHTIFGRVIDGLAVLDRMEAVETDGSDRPLNKIVMQDLVVLIDPFDEFLRETRRHDREEEARADVQRRGGTDDDRTTWTGKRIRADGTLTDGGAPSGVGKYLKKATTVAGAEAEAKRGSAAKEGAVAVDSLDAWEEPARKKIKRAGGGGFGNFDNW